MIPLYVYIWTDCSSCFIHLYPTISFPPPSLLPLVPPSFTSSSSSADYFFYGYQFPPNISIEFQGRTAQDLTILWKKDNSDLSNEGDGYRIVTSCYGDMSGITSLVFTGIFLSRSLKGNYIVVIENTNDVIPEEERRVEYNISLRISGERDNKYNIPIDS